MVMLFTSQIYMNFWRYILKMGEQASPSDITALFEKHEIIDFELNTAEKQVWVRDLDAFNRLIVTLGVDAFQQDAGEFAPYGMNMIVYFDYKGWRYGSSLAYKESGKES